MDWAHDDVPTYMRTKSGKPILSLPYPQELNDIPTIMVRRSSASDFADMIIDNLEELIASQGPDKSPVVMGIALHPYVIGQPFRMKHLKRALDFIEERKNEQKIWLTTAGNIADAWKTMAPPTPDDFKPFIPPEDKRPLVK